MICYIDVPLKAGFDCSIDSDLLYRCAPLKAGLTVVDSDLLHRCALYGRFDCSIYSDL